MRRRGFILLAGGAALLAACGSGGGRPSGGARGGRDVLAVARGAGAGRFVRAAEAAGLAETLGGPGPDTLFAPTDAAFGRSDAGRLDGDALRRLISYHVVPGDLTTDFMAGMDFNHTTLLGSSVNVDGTAEPMRVGGASILRADLLAANGVVFVIDAVLTPRPVPAR